MEYLKTAPAKGQDEGQKLKEQVADIVHNVRQQGDAALIHYNTRFEGNTRPGLRIGAEEIAAAYQKAEPGLIDDMWVAARNLEAFAQKQKSTLCHLPETEITEGVYLSHRIIPVEACCCYVPGGLHPLFSTALMLAIPAKVAGVQRIAACSPAMRDSNSIHPATLVALDIAGVNEIYAVGGAHAIVAFSYGTEQIRPVDIIVGPGNRYVTEAKRQCYGQVGIDFLAGPSEILVIADDSADPEVIACDLLAQSEHDLNAAAILVTTSKALGEQVMEQVGKQLATLPTADVAKPSWENNGVVALAASLEEACAFSNSYAPEHLEIQTRENERITPLLTNYGSLFAGEFAAEVFGDYAAGTNHTLPTLRVARYSGGLFVGTFLKTCTTQRLTKRGIENIGGVAERMARAEGLHAHGNAAAVRNKFNS